MNTIPHARLVLIRHGESETNAANQFTGWSDPVLTASGRDEARKVALCLLAAGVEPARTTSFELRSLPTGKTRLVAQATHRLRIDPALYWEPLARWGIKMNVTRVLESIKDAAEGPSGSGQK